MKKTALILCMILLCATQVQAAGEIGTEYLTRGMWRGFDIWGTDGIMRAYTSTDVGPLDFAASFWQPTQSGNEEQKRIDGTVSYGIESGDFDYVIGYSYYSFPEGSSHNADASADLQEMFAGVSTGLELFGLDLRPSYTAVQTWSSNAGQINLTAGALHIFGVGVDLNPVFLSGEVIYNDGVEYQGRVDHDWSHAIFGAGVNIPVTDTIVFRPAAFYELAMDDSVIEKDEGWLSFSFTCPF